MGKYSIDNIQHSIISLSVGVRTDRKNEWRVQTPAIRKNEEDLKLTDREKDLIKAIRNLKRSKHNPSKSLEWYVRLFLKDF